MKRPSPLPAHVVRIPRAEVEGMIITWERLLLLEDIANTDTIVVIEHVADMELVAQLHEKKLIVRTLGKGFRQSTTFARWWRQNKDDIIQALQESLKLKDSYDK